MKNGLKKLYAAVLLIALVSIVFSGCSSKKAVDAGTPSATPAAMQTKTVSPTVAPTADPKADTKEEVKLKMYLMGEAPPDKDEVYAELNKMLKKDINATVEPVFFTWSDWDTKYNLLLSSGEDYDLIFAATWTNFADKARKGAFLEIKPDMLAKYAPETAKYSQDVLSSGLVDGKLLGLPANKQEFTTAAYVVRGNLMKKYNVPDIKKLDDFGVYLDAIAKNEKGLVPYDIGTPDAYFPGVIASAVNGWRSVPQASASVKVNDPALKVFSFLDQPESLAHFKKMKEWNDKGYWSKNALVNKVSAKDSFTNGKSASAIVNLTNANEMYVSLKTSHPEWDVKVFNALSGTVPSVSSFMSNGMAINAKSKHPERALMLLDLLKNNEAYNDLTNYGIKGKHYTVDDKGKLVFPAASTGYPPRASSPWGWNNQALEKSFASELPNFQDIMAEYKKDYKPDPLREFNLDITKIADIAAVFNDLNNQYGKPRDLGNVKGSVEDSVKVQQDKFKAAGIDKYFAEIQKQIDAYLAQQKK